MTTVWLLTIQRIDVSDTSPYHGVYLSAERAQKGFINYVNDSIGDSRDEDDEEIKTYDQACDETSFTFRHSIEEIELDADPT
jgi:hypothetical protein